MAPLFFFSYARADYDVHLQKFYGDLCKEISLATQVQGEPGFFDQRDIELGGIWSEKLKEALRTSKSLVSVFSPKYLASDYCGKEFQVCFDRQSRSRATSTALFPVIWGAPSGSLHKVIEGIQFTAKGFPRVYAEEGLFFLIKLKRLEDEYTEFVSRLARNIVDVIAKHPLPEILLPSLQSVKNPFEASTANPPLTSRQAFFSYVVGRPDELKRAEVERYGRGGKDWRPFHPDYPHPIGRLAMRVALDQDLDPAELELGKDLVARIEEAERRGDLVILLVDPWTVRIESYSTLMREYDKRNFQNSAVLIAWNSPDNETELGRLKLESALQATFKFKGVKKSIYYSDKIRSPRELKSTLAKTLAKLRNGLIESGTSQVPISDETLKAGADANGIQLHTQPIVSGPGEVRW